MKSRSDLPPGLNFVEDDKPSESAGLSKSAKKKQKQKEKKKQAAAAVGDKVEEVTNTLKSASLAETKRPDKKSQSEEVSATAADPAKKLKNLKKKLRQIESLESKIKSGELKNPEKEQLDKVSKKQEIVDEIEDLELELMDV